MAYVNMSQSGATCPQGLTQRTLSGLTLCGRNNTKSGGCQSTVFSTLGLNYSRVCGQLRGYQFGLPDGFYPYYTNPSFTVDNLYVDGVSITYGSAPRKHIWTYANGQSSRIVPLYAVNCPCNNASSYFSPYFIGSDYYCEAGINGDVSCCQLWIDPLWDGQQCPSEEAP